MVEMKQQKINPICSKHKVPVTITIPQNRIGNAHGEEWYCPKCKCSPEKIIHSRMVNCEFVK